jgi:tetratricopeptide (TPR) repeat protein
LANLLLIKKKDEAALGIVEKVLADHPQHIDALTLAGQIYNQRKRLDDAVKVYEKVIDLTPNQQNIYLMLGRIYWNRNDLGNAERIFRKMTINIPHSYAAFYFLGKVLASQEKTDEAEKVLLRSLELETGIEEPLVELLAIYKGQQKDDKVTETYQSLLELNPQNYEAAFGLARHYHALHRDDASLEILRALGSAVHKDGRIIPTLFDLFIQKKAYGDAIWALEGMLQAASQSSDLHYMAGIAYDGAGDQEKAVDHLLLVHPASRFYTNAVVHCAFLFHDQGRLDRSIEVVKKALGHDPDHIDYYLYLGSFYEALERYDDALKILRSGLLRDSKNARLHFRFGVVLDKQGRKQESIEAMKNVLRLTPDDAEAMNYLGYTYADLGINLEEAEALIQGALAIKPDDGYITDSLGWVYYKQGLYSQALEWLMKAVKLIPDDPTILEHLGDLHRSMEHKDKALEYYQRSLNKKNNGRDALEEKIRQLGGD